MNELCIQVDQIHPDMTIEQLTVEQLERLGFQTIDRGTS